MSGGDDVKIVGRSKNWSEQEKQLLMRECMKRIEPLKRKGHTDKELVKIWDWIAERISRKCGVQTRTKEQTKRKWQNMRPFALQSLSVKIVPNDKRGAQTPIVKQEMDVPGIEADKMQDLYGIVKTEPIEFAAMDEQPPASSKTDQSMVEIPQRPRRQLRDRGQLKSAQNIGTVSSAASTAGPRVMVSNAKPKRLARCSRGTQTAIGPKVSKEPQGVLTKKECAKMLRCLADLIGGFIANLNSQQ